MVESVAGEDTLVICSECGYAANLEIATSNAKKLKENSANSLKISTPNVKTIDELAEFLKIHQLNVQNRSFI